MNSFRVRPSFLFIALLLSSPVVAVPTDVTVRVISQGAKFIGSHTGGAEILLRDAETGQLLAEGITSGGTGNTKTIMGGVPRNQPRADADTAAFRTRLDIAAPRRVEVVASGPLGHPGSTGRAAAVFWLLPGAPVLGDGWVLELPGLVVEAEPVVPGAGTLAIAANVTMLCGCPIDAGGLWDAARFDVHAYIVAAGKPVADAPLAFTGTTGRFAASLPVGASGPYALTITATDRGSGATGVGRLSLP